MAKPENAKHTTLTLYAPNIRDYVSDLTPLSKMQEQNFIFTSDDILKLVKWLEKLG